MSKPRRSGNTRQSQQPQQQPPPPPTQQPPPPQPPAPRVDQLLIGTEQRGTDRSAITRKVVSPPEKKEK
jgi:hypothetical protein